MEEKGIVTTTGIVLTKRLVHPREPVVRTRFFRSDERRIELDPILQVHTTTGVCGQEDDVADGDEDDGTGDENPSLACSVGESCASVQKNKLVKSFP